MPGPSDNLKKHAKPPPHLDLSGDMPSAWKLFKKRWDNYVLMSGLGKEERPLQIAQLENCLGDDALKTLEGFQFDTGEDQRTVKEILDAFTAYTIGETNETLERFKFGKRTQQEGESIDKFVAALRILMKTCQYCPACAPSILRDRIVLGIRSDDAREDMLKERALTLEKAINICKAAESATTHTDSLKPESVNRIQDGATRRRNTSFGKRDCIYCPFKHRLVKEECPAWGNACKRCGRRNHHEAKCKADEHTIAPSHDQQKPRRRKGRSPKQVNNLEKESSEECSDSEYAWCNSIDSMDNSSHKKYVKCKMLVEGQEVPFLIDSGATVNTLPARYASKPLEPYTGMLKMWNQAEDKPLGTCRLKVKNPKNGMKYNVPFIVFEGDRLPILSNRTSLQMKLIKFQLGNFDIAAVTSDLFTDVFDNKLGRLPGIQKLRLKEGAQPMIMANRRVPISVRPKLKQELDRLVKLQVIAPVDEPTPWVSQIVIAHKKSGDLRICLDPHELNKVIQREHYTLPILEDVLHELRDSKFFSKADLSSGYWHVQLDEKSSYLTTFQTYSGRYRYLRLPFGINGASEYFQKKLIASLDGLPGVVCIADDVIIHGRSRHEHDENLHLFLSRCQKTGIKLNHDKFHCTAKRFRPGEKINHNGTSTYVLQPCGDPHP